MSSQSPACAHASSQPGRNRLGWKLRLVVGVGLPLGLVAGLEGALRLAGYGYPTTFFLSRTINNQAVWVDNWQFGWRFFPRALARSPYPFVMARHKSRDTIRIFVLGESAALGVPAPEFGFSRMLEVLLQDQVPDRKTEVINVSMVAINSHVILPIARECARRQGDLWVIYMGNNEVIGPFGAHALFGPAAPPRPLIQASLALKTLRVGQLLDEALQQVRRASQVPPQWQGMSMWRAPIPRDDPRVQRVHAHFSANLAAILQAAQRAGVPVILCTVGCNLKDCSPFASMHRPGLTPQQQAVWDQAYQAGQEAQRQEQFSQAIQHYSRALELDDRFAELHFRLATCYLALGRTNEAQVHFQRARDEDALQFRPDSRLNQIIRQQATAAAAAKVRLLDAEALFARHSPQGIPGHELFYEHVHLTPAGNYLLARAVAELAIEALGPRAGSSRAATAPPWLSRTECEQRLGLTDLGRLQILELVEELISVPPFTTQSIHTHRLQRLQAEARRLRSARQPAGLAAALQQVQAAVQRRPDDPELWKILAPLLEAAGDPAGAEACWRKVIQRTPQAAIPYLNLAFLLRRQGRVTEAIQAYQECLRRNWEHAEAHGDLGALLLDQNQPAAAIPHLRFVVQRQPQAVEAHWLLGQALLRTHQRQAALRQFEQVLRLNPNHAQARRALEQLRQTR
jgi:tetratricopeptide (TPR) repeat protein